MEIVSISPPGTGIQEDSDECLLLNNTATALAVGDPMMVDHSAVNTALLFFRVMAMATAGLPSSWFVVARQVIPAGAVGVFGVNGSFLCKIVTNGAAIGAKLIGTNGAVGTGVTVSAAEAATGFFKIIAINKEATTAGNQVKRVAFSGIHGYGGAGA